ncbi:hypothetical protein JEZ13_11760 [bacterium]|nr:hypothetical protein [bacterium]
MKISTKMVTLVLGLALIYIQLPGQGFDINRFSNPRKYGWENYQDRAEYRQDLTARQEMLQLYEIKTKSITYTMAKSAIFPGWGHYGIESYSKGHTFLTGGVVIAGAGLYFYSRSQDYYKQYKNATQINEINDKFDKAEQNYNTSMIFLGAYLILWGYNLYDSSESTERYNADLWDKILLKNFDNISLTPNSIEVRF